MGSQNTVRKYGACGEFVCDFDVFERLFADVKSVGTYFAEGGLCQLDEKIKKVDDQDIA